VCVFPHSDDEFPTAVALRNFLNRMLPNQMGRYLLRKLKRCQDKDFKAGVVPGNLVLFRKGAIIVDDAEVQDAIRKLDPPEHDKTELGCPMVYYHDIRFNPEGINVYPQGRPVTMLENWSGQRLHRNYYAILGTRRDYEQMFPR
jgi:hypothetical protein